jgi:ketosteroid isomerase-like protein
MRKIGLIVLGIAMCGASSARAQGTAADEKKIIANEHMISESVMKKDLKMFHMMVDTQGVGVDGGGVTKVSDMDKMFQQMNITASKVDQEKVMWITPDVAVLTYRWTGKGTAAGQAMPGASYSSTVYAKQKNGDWIAKFHQESLIAPAPPAAAEARPAAPAKK